MWRQHDICGGAMTAESTTAKRDISSSPHRPTPPTNTTTTPKRPHAHCSPKRPSKLSNNHTANMLFGLLPLIKSPPPSLPKLPSKLTNHPVIILIINGIAILSEDRFLARIGWAATQPEQPSFGGNAGDVSVKAKMVNLISATRLLTRSKCLSAAGRGILVDGEGRSGNVWGIWVNGVNNSTAHWDQYSGYYLRVTSGLDTCRRGRRKRGRISMESQLLLLLQLLPSYDPHPLSHPNTYPPPPQQPSQSPPLPTVLIPRPVHLHTPKPADHIHHLVRANRLLLLRH